MNATPTQPDSNDRTELARLLPPPTERDLPSDRHRQLQELVMSQIQQDLRAAEPAPHHSQKRRLVLVAAALTAVAAIAVAVATIGTGGPRSAGGTSVPRAASVSPGQQILLAAADTAERTPEGSGTYWHVKVVSADTNGKPYQWEYWTRRDGQTWFRGDKSGGNVIKLGGSVPFRLGGPEVTVEQLQNLPTKPAALKAWIADAIKHSDVTTSAGKPDAATQERSVFEGLISLVSQLPAPPKVRAAAFQAIASYPNVESLGAVEGGQGLLISFDDGRQARLVVDPATSRIRETNFLVSADDSEIGAGGAGTFTLVVEWTNQLPR